MQNYGGRESEGTIVDLLELKSEHQNDPGQVCRKGARRRKNWSQAPGIHDMITGG